MTSATIWILGRRNLPTSTDSPPPRPGYRSEILTAGAIFCPSLGQSHWAPDHEHPQRSNPVPRQGPLPGHSSLIIYLTVQSNNSTQIQSAFSDWPVPNINFFHSCIVFSQHQEFITYATNRTVNAWDTSTHPHLALIQHNANIHSIAFSPEYLFLEVVKAAGKPRFKIYTSSL